MWSYTFTNYDNFTQSSNAITPRPIWPGVSNVPISTTPPLNETDYNAVNFWRWKQLGREILIKSNINNWLICHPENGSLVDWWQGNVSCRIVKYVTDTCNETAAPVLLHLDFFGPIFFTKFNNRDSRYYYFESFTRDEWPVHDPCGKSEANQVTNVVNPHGNIFIRG